MAGILRDRLTPARLGWLRKLRDEGVSNRSSVVVGYHCMHLGWTDFACRDETTGEQITLREWWRRHLTDERRLPDEFLGEMLTEKGRKRLEEHDGG